MKKIFFFALLSAAFTAQAQIPPAGKLREAYFQLMNDFNEEILTMDAVVEPLETRQKAIESLKSALQTGKPDSFRFDPKLSWAPTWPVNPTQSKMSAQTFESIPAPHIPNSEDRHSIQNLEGYLKARLGSQAVIEIQRETIRPLVLGGNESSLATLLSTEASHIYKLPGLYQSWGIQKFLVGSENGPPRLVYVVPPAKEYLEHYQMMLTQVTGKPVQVVRSSRDFQNWREELAQGVREIGRRLGGSFDYVTLGYFNQWREVLGGQILEQKEASLPSGHMGRFYLIEAGGQRIRILTLGHQKTIWGEASAFLLEGAFDFRPRGIFFLGSAGSISSRTDVYQISAPRSFRTKQGGIQLSNLIHLAQGNFQSSVPVQYSAVHGNTSSPASQTIAYLTKQVQFGVDTLDVEQSLIAARIEAYNRQHQTQIQFGAVNLITDKPLGHSDNDLDRVDLQKKAKSRLAAVQLTFSALLAEKAKPTQCGRVH